MTATNIDIVEFINVLKNVRDSGVRKINLDMLPDTNHPNMNKLVIHPMTVEEQENAQPSNPRRFVVRNPDISTDNDDIFNKFYNE